MAVKGHKRPNRVLSRSVEILAQVPDNVKYLELDANGTMKVLFKDRQEQTIAPNPAPGQALIPSLPNLVAEVGLTPAQLQAEYAKADSKEPLSDLDLLLVPPKGMDIPYLEQEPEQG